MTRDELTEAIARDVYDAMRFVREFDTPAWAIKGNSFAQDRARAAASAIVDMVIPPPLVWEKHGDGDWMTDHFFISESGGAFHLSAAEGGYAYEVVDHHPTLAAAQAAAQAHTDAAHIAGMRIAKEGR